jgi:hypothetical protein
MEQVTVFLSGVVHFLLGTPLSYWLRNNAWPYWPMLQTLHLFGMTLLIGAVGLFDLRVLGLGKSIPPAALHKLIPFGVAGFLLNATTGTLFFIGNPDQYAFNLAFRLKLVAMVLAGINLLLFFGTVYGDVKLVPAGGVTPLRAKVMTGVSLFSWTAVIVCARILTWFRPVYFGQAF